MTTSIQNYPYYANINTPAQLGMTPGSSLSNVEDGVSGLVNYIQLLVQGTSSASATGAPLGNRYLLQTNQSCTNTDGSTVTRDLYINNVPSGGLGLFPDGAMGQNFSSFQGLVPGALEDVLSLSQIDFLSAFTSTDVPKCQSVTLQTIDDNNNIGYGTGYVTLDDLNNVPPCVFQSGYNPVTNTSCEGFKVSSSSDDETSSQGSSILYKKKKNNKNNKKNKKKSNNNKNKDKPIRMPDDIFLKIFIYSFGAFWVYVMLKLLANMYKKRN
jgi:hypothetical protein